jgi:hypothetical protein
MAHFSAVVRVDPEIGRRIEQKVRSGAAPKPAEGRDVPSVRKEPPQRTAHRSRQYEAA